MEKFRFPIYAIPNRKRRHQMNNEIKLLRKQLDTLDNSLLTILEKRFQLCKKIGDNKKKNNLKIKDSKREKEILNHKIKTTN